jgi:hypothetical protein
MEKLERAKTLTREALQALDRNDLSQAMELLPKAHDAVSAAWVERLTRVSGVQKY